jgi:hypothetical protein
MGPAKRILRALAAAALGLASLDAAAEEGFRFPPMKATSLAGRSLELPADLGKPASLAFVAFQMRQQEEIDAWKPFVERARASFPGLAAWEFPSIGSGYKLMRGVIEGGMRSGITSRTALERTAALFLDVGAFARSIGASDTGRIAVLVLAPDGRVLATASGGPSRASEAALEAALAAAFSGARAVKP